MPGASKVGSVIRRNPSASISMVGPPTRVGVSVPSSRLLEHGPENRTRSCGRTGARGITSACGEPAHTHRFGRTATRCHTFVANRQLRRGNKRRGCRVLIPSVGYAPASVFGYLEGDGSCSTCRDATSSFPPALRLRLASMAGSRYRRLLRRRRRTPQKDL